MKTSFDAVGRSARHLLGDFRPPLAVLFTQMQQLCIFLIGPFAYFERRVQKTCPPLTALLGVPRVPHPACHGLPHTHPVAAVLPNQADQFLVLREAPRAKNDILEFRSDGLAPALRDLRPGAPGDEFSDLGPGRVATECRYCRA